MATGYFARTASELPSGKAKPLDVDGCDCIGNRQSPIIASRPLARGGVHKLREDRADDRRDSGLAIEGPADSWTARDFPSRDVAGNAAVVGNQATRAATSLAHDGPQQSRNDTDMQQSIRNLPSFFLLLALNLCCAADALAAGWCSDFAAKASTCLTTQQRLRSSQAVIVKSCYVMRSHPWKNGTTGTWKVAYRNSPGGTGYGYTWDYFCGQPFAPQDPAPLCAGSQASQPANSGTGIPAKAPATQCEASKANQTVLRVIDSAEKSAHEERLDLSGLQLRLVKRFSTPANDVMDPSSKDANKQSIMARLKNRAYWAACYVDARAEDNASVCFFIDASSYALIAAYSGN